MFFFFFFFFGGGGGAVKTNNKYINILIDAPNDFGMHITGIHTI